MKRQPPTWTDVRKAIARCSGGLLGPPETFDAPPPAVGPPPGAACGGCASIMNTRRNRDDCWGYCGFETTSTQGTLFPERRYPRVSIHTPACRNWTPRPPDEHDE